MTFKDVQVRFRKKKVELKTEAAPSWSSEASSKARSQTKLVPRQLAGSKRNWKPKTKRVCCHECQNEIETENENENETRRNWKLKTQRDVRRSGPKAGKSCTRFSCHKVLQSESQPHLPPVYSGRWTLCSGQWAVATDTTPPPPPPPPNLKLGYGGFHLGGRPQEQSLVMELSTFFGCHFAWEPVFGVF